jgi:hypothetical protein
MCENIIEFDDLNFKKVSVYVRNLNVIIPAECLLLKNCVGQINSISELNKINFKNEYNIKTTKTSSKILYKYISNLLENNSSNILKSFF